MLRPVENSQVWQTAVSTADSPARSSAPPGSPRRRRPAALLLALAGWLGAGLLAMASAAEPLLTLQ
ncbi:MAG: hypothetical protein ACKOGA_19125, partial [Planctomycetaceae bacterium]